MHWQKSSICTPSLTHNILFWRANFEIKTNLLAIVGNGLNDWCLLFALYHCSSTIFCTKNYALNSFAFLLFESINRVIAFTCTLIAEHCQVFCRSLQFCRLSRAAWLLANHHFSQRFFWMATHSCTPTHWKRERWPTCQRNTSIGLLLKLFMLSLFAKIIIYFLSFSQCQFFLQLLMDVAVGIDWACTILPVRSLFFAIIFFGLSLATVARRA